MRLLANFAISVLAVSCGRSALERELRHVSGYDQIEGADCIVGFHDPFPKVCAYGKEQGDRIVEGLDVLVSDACRSFFTPKTGLTYTLAMRALTCVNTPRAEASLKRIASARGYQPFCRIDALGVLKPADEVGQLSAMLAEFSGPGYYRDQILHAWLSLGDSRAVPALERAAATASSDAKPELERAAERLRVPQKCLLNGAHGVVPRKSPDSGIVSRACQYDCVGHRRHVVMRDVSGDCPESIDAPMQ